MVYALKRALRSTPLIHVVRHSRRMYEWLDWYVRGKTGSAPHLVKRRIVREYARRFDTHILVETGTYFGEMIDATKHLFASIYSVELDETLCEKARKRFAKFHHISVICGDSGELLPDILSDIGEPAVFWLDAHYSGGVTAKADLDTPIVQELRSILSHPVVGHIILVDDARCFDGQSDYPTLEQVRELVAQYHPTWSFELCDDIIRIHGEQPN